MKLSTIVGILGVIVLLDARAPAQLLPPDIQPISQDLGISDSPKVAVSGSNVYFVWRSDDAGIGVTGQQILFRRSTNYGITFEPVQVLSDNTDDNEEVRDPTIAAVGNRVFVAWAQRVCNGTCSYDIFICSSTDGGVTFSAVINLSIVLDGQQETRPRRPLAYSDEGDDIMPALAADGNYIYLVWASESEGTFDIWFVRWNIAADFANDAPEVFLNLSNSYKPVRNPGVLATRGDALYPAIAVDGTFVYIAWADNHPKPRANFSIYTLSSTQRGDDLVNKKPTNLRSPRQRTCRQRTGNCAICPALAARRNTGYLAWSESRDGRFEVLFTSSSAGRRYTTPVVISALVKPSLGMTPGDSLCPALAAGSTTVYLSWPDSTPENFEIIALANPMAPHPISRVTNLSRSWGDSEQIALALDSNERLYAVWMDKSSGKPEIYFRGRQELPTRTTSVSHAGRLPTQLSVQGGIFVLKAGSLDIVGIELEIFGLHGRRVAHLSSEGSRLEFKSIAQNDVRLANGVYLYVVRVRGVNGEEYVSEVRKLVILR